MSTSTLSMTNELSNYIIQTSVSESELAKTLRLETQNLEMARMQISPHQANFMKFMAKMIQAKSYLEIGVFTGYSCLNVMEAMGEQATAVACDISKEWTDIAVQYWEEAGISKNIELKVGPALKSLQTLKKRTFDLIFIDANKEDYLNYYEEVLPLLTDTGLIMIDNIFWGGQVADPEIDDSETNAIRELNQFVMSDDRVNATMVSIGDGIMLINKKRE